MRRLAGDVLGFSWRAAGGGDDGTRDGLIQLLVDLRNEARQARNFALGDQIRNRLAALGVQLKDGPSGTTW
jgi:cysteinyl-tRNA synthetase